MLLARWRAVLSKEELEQVEYVKQVTVGRQGNTVSGPCPRCGRPLELLTPSCSFCRAEVVVCFRERRLCDAQAAAFCTLCAAGASVTKSEGVRAARSGGVPHSVKASTCFVCGVGEMRSRQEQGMDLAY